MKAGNCQNGYLRSALIMVVGFGLFAAQGAAAQTFTVLHNFAGRDGARPGSGITMDRFGSIYGSTQYGGDISCNLSPGGGGTPGCGVVYKLKHQGSGWIIDVLHMFEQADGDYIPYPGEPTIAPNGVLYDITDLGGSYRAGTLFSQAPATRTSSSANSAWTYNILHTFTGNDDGGNPTRLDHLYFDQAGNIYGTTTYGGAASAGVIYQLSRSGGEWVDTPLYIFSGGSDGSHVRGMTFDEAGNMYGVAAYGGNRDCGFGYGCGLIFKLTHTQSGWTKTALHVFQQDTEGGWSGPLIRDAAGNLYGITEENGPNNASTVWELSPSGDNWVFTLLHVFPTSVVNDFGPYRLTMDSAGDLYGVANWGGTHNEGFLFKLTPSNGSWAYSEPYEFGSAPGQTDGCGPQGAVVMDASGNLYGATEWCGVNGVGTVWEFTP